MTNENRTVQPESISRAARQGEIIERGRTTPDRPVQRPPWATTTSQTDKKE